MIKCNVNVCGIVSKAPTQHTNKEGKPFVSLAVDVVIKAKQGINKTITLDVIKDGNDEQLLGVVSGERIELAGMLMFKKRGDAMYYNLTATGVNYASEATEDKISGDMEFRGKLGKKIDEKETKKGGKMLIFSGFSAEKVNDGFEYVWVRFIAFDKEREAWLQPSCRIKAKGELELSVFNDRLDIGCRITDMKEYIPQEYNPNR